MWLCQTRLDLVADIVLLQGDISIATIGHLKQANLVVRKAQKYRDGCGLIYPRISPPFVLWAPHDSSHAREGLSYAQEGALTLLAEDRHIPVDSKNMVAEADSSYLGGFCHVLASLGRKGKRVAPSTSSAETNAAVSAKEVAQLVAMRLTEVMYTGIGWPLRERVSLSLLITIQEKGAFVVPIDNFTDCQDLFDLVKGTPQDRHQRLYVMSIREDRLARRMRRFWKISTQYMIADALTKHMLSPIMMDLITIGYWLLRSPNDKPSRYEVLPTPTSFDFEEHNLETLTQPHAQSFSFGQG